MSEMIHRVAKAILKARAPKQSREAWAEAAARDAILAMRHPTGRMALAGEEAVNVVGQVDLGRIDVSDAAACYSAMIDEALKDG